MVRSDPAVRRVALGLRRCGVVGSTLIAVAPMAVRPMAVRLGYDAPLLAAIAGRLARAVMQDMRHGVKQQHGLAVASLHAGVVTVVQRFRSDLGLYVHLHCLATDGAYEEQNDGDPLPKMRRPHARP